LSIPPAPIPACPPSQDGGVIVDVELSCWTLAPSPLWAVFVWDADQTPPALVSTTYIDPATGSEVTPNGDPAVCSDVVIPNPLPVDIVAQTLAPLVISGSVSITGQPVTITGAVTVTGTVDVGNFPAVQSVDDNGGSLTIDTDAGPIDVVITGQPIAVSGTVDVGNFPASQTVNDGGGSLTVDGTVDVGNFPASQTVDDGGGSLTVDGTVDIGNEPIAIEYDTTTGDEITPRKTRLNGPGASWDFTSAAGRVKSVTVICINDGVGGGPGAGSDVTVTDASGASSDVNTGEVVEWATDAFDDELVDGGGAFAVTLGPGGGNAYVDVIWTEVL